MKSWHACRPARARHCARKLRQPASRSPRSARSRRGRGRRAFSLPTVSRSHFGKPRSAISEHPRLAALAIVPCWPQSGRRARQRARASFVAILAGEKPGAPQGHLMHDTTALVRSAANDYTPADNPRFIELHRRFPTVAYLRRPARRNVPSFAFEYMDGGAGADGGIARHWSALDAVELVPRYGVPTALPPVGIELFGRHYSAPVGVAPMGGPSIVWPGADQYLAAAAQRARVPYTLGLVGGMTGA